MKDSQKAIPNFNICTAALRPVRDYVSATMGALRLPRGAEFQAAVR
jgi:hypothetical protein